MKFTALLSATVLLFAGAIAYPQVGESPPPDCKPVPLDLCHSRDIGEDSHLARRQGDPTHEPVRPGLYCGLCPHLTGRGVVYRNGYYIDDGGRCCDIGASHVCDESPNSRQCPFGGIDH
ncbi:hypothetical protein McanCB56680_001336 [Microsporum canis]|uniref:Uncharacterized protein n=1 Tax=Arthroderma otae (strain ATCC MYA-4605 / CBS 113480) TaxID=554155 RepID=C5FHB9_ARTOC|nr:uncharacterized protein MCYG_01657 [Microsporum canis CBS 113480]EEQ28838.1 predicted protein [Microsporum canis CBS 113480]